MIERFPDTPGADSVTITSQMIRRGVESRDRRQQAVKTGGGVQHWGIELRYRQRPAALLRPLVEFLQRHGDGTAFEITLDHTRCDETGVFRTRAVFNKGRNFFTLVGRFPPHPLDEYAVRTRGYFFKTDHSKIYMALGWVGPPIHYFGFFPRFVSTSRPHQIYYNCPPFTVRLATPEIQYRSRGAGGLADLSVDLIEAWDQ